MTRWTACDIMLVWTLVDILISALKQINIAMQAC